MKKTYIKPEMKIEVLELENMIALSYKTGSDPDDYADWDQADSKQRNDNWSGLLW